MELFTSVLVSTLCRDKHFRRTIASLQRCTHAAETELYIALDYPLKPSHQPGWEAIREFLPTISGFKKVSVIAREKNFGSANNVRLAMIEILHSHESVIYLEDDNEVAPNFLDFLNKGLQKYDCDNTVFAICAYSFRDDFPHLENTFYRQNDGFNVWGCAISKEKFFQYQQKFTRGYCIRKLLNPCTLIKGAVHSWGTILFMILKIVKPTLMTDNTYSIYMFYEHKDVVMPIKSLVLNSGFDGSGEHCAVDDSYAMRAIPADTVFDFVGTGMEFRKEIHKVLLDGKRKYIPFSRMCSTLFKMVLSRLKKR